MTASHWPAGRLLSLTVACLGASLALLLAPGPGWTAQAAVSFSPARVPQGGSVTVKAGPADRFRTVVLGRKATIQAGDETLGVIPEGKAKARLRVPRTVKPGRYLVISCTEIGCVASKEKLTVFATKGGKKPDRRVFRLRYVHKDKASHAWEENDGGFAGRVTWKQSFALKSNLKVKNGKGSGPIRYTRARSMRKRVGRFASQAGGLGTPGECSGSSTSTLTGTRNGTARVLRLKVRGKKISLDFRPGPVLQSRGVPAERIRSVSTFASMCADADSSNWNRIFLNDFGNFYNARRQLQTTTGSNPFFVRLDKGWKVWPNRKKGFAKLVVKGKMYTALTYRDTFIIDRVR